MHYDSDFPNPNCFQNFPTPHSPKPTPLLTCLIRKEKQESKKHRNKKTKTNNLQYEKRNKK